MRLHPGRFRRCAAMARQYSMRRTQAGPSIAPAGVSREARALTARQVEAITTVMRLFVEEDLAGGMPAGRRMRCQACGQQQPAAGFVRYGSSDICNRCATAYELCRACGRVRTIEEYLHEEFPRTSSA